MPEHQFAFTTRTVRPTDLPYILSTWAKAARDAALVKGMDVAPASSFLRSIFVRQLEAPDVSARVATPLDDDDTLLGWSVYSSEALHFVYVRRNFRGIGIARSLVPTGIDKFTFHTRCIRRFPDGWNYRPDLLFVQDK